MSVQCKPSVTVTLEEYIWFFLSDALKRSACSFLRRETPHLFFLPLNWKDRPTPFLASWYIIRHGALLETSQPASASSALSQKRTAQTSSLPNSQATHKALEGPPSPAPHPGVLCLLFCSLWQGSPPRSAPSTQSTTDAVSGRGKVWKFLPKKKFNNFHSRDGKDSSCAL